jgi:hypothetical protein
MEKSFPTWTEKAQKVAKCPLKKIVTSFSHFSLHLEAAASLATITLYAFSRWDLSHTG